MKQLNKFLKMFLFILVAVISIFSFNSYISAYPSSISNVKKNSTLKYNGYDQLIYKTSDNYHMFCAKFHVNGVGTSCKLASNQWSTPTQAGIAAIVEKYNNSKSKKNYYYAELAINEFLYYYETKDTKNRISSTRDVRNTTGVKGFYDAAVKAYNNAKKKYSISINTSSDKLTFKLDGNYYVSNKITIKETNGSLDNYIIALSGDKDAKVYKKSGKTFYVRVPKKNVKVGSSVDIKVAVKATKSYSIAKKFDCGSSVQPLTPNVTMKNNINASATKTGTITLKGNKVEILKKDSETKKVLVGATLVVKDANGKQVDKWISETNAHVLKNLEAGEYTLSEEKAPANYELNKKEVKFTVKNDNKTIIVEMLNTKKEETIVKILKKDSETKEPLEGATLVVRNSKGNEVDKWVSTNEAHILKNLKVGEYTLSEVKAPTGYVLNKEEIKFTVKNDNKTITVEMLNTPADNPVEISKQDITTSKELPGATLVVKDKTGKVIDKWVSTNEIHIIKDLNPGDYTLTETIAPEGYILSKETVKFTVKGDGSVTKVVMYNTPKANTIVKIFKKDSETKEILKGATLVVKDINGNVVDEWVSGTEAHVLNDLSVGEYILTETNAPFGYVLSTEEVKFEVKRDGETIELEIVNTKAENPVEISKQDATTSKELPGATLVVKDKDGNIIDEWVSTNEIHIIKDLKPGDYTLTETIAPVGYILSTETVKFTVKGDGSVTKVVMYNSPAPMPAPEISTNPKHPVEISKQDITTKQELPGATLVVSDANGKEITRWVSQATPHYLDLEPGDYMLTEIQAPVGYDLSYEVVRFTVTDTSEVQKVVMYNSKTPNTADKNIILIVGLMASALTGIGITIFKMRKSA